MAPLHRTRAGVEGEELVVRRQHEHPALGDGRCRADRGLDGTPPDLGPGAGVEGQHVAAAAGDEEAAIVVGEAAAAEPVARAPLLGPDPPGLAAVGGAEGGNPVLGVDREHDAGGRDRGRQEARAPSGPSADVGGPGRTQRVGGLQVVHGMGGDAARLRPLGVAPRPRQRDRGGGDLGIGPDVLVEQQDRLARTRQRRVLALAEPGAATPAATGKGQARGQEGGPPGQPAAHGAAIPPSVASSWPTRCCCAWGMSTSLLSSSSVLRAPALSPVRMARRARSSRAV